jgi:acetyl esterase/lipase
MRPTMGALTLFTMLAVRSADAQPTIEKNIVYGMHSGLALLMDVHRPDHPNGYGVIHVAGSSWHASLAYGAVPLKESQIQYWAPTLLRAGYTVFTINHRAAPVFRYPAAVEDVQRAVRFVRHNAQQFGVDPARLGGMGSSSGAHLLGLVAMLRAPGLIDDPDPVNREPATLQAVVLRSGRLDMSTRPLGPAAASFIGLFPRDEAAWTVYAAASPITHVSPGAPPVLLLHGDSDDVIPFEQSVAMEKALRAANVPTKLVRIPGGGHDELFGADGKPNPSWPNYFAEIVAWLDQHLKTAGTGDAASNNRPAAQR